MALPRFDGGARGMLCAGQVAVGHDNDLRLRVMGTEGGLDWCHDEPDVLRHTPFGESTRLPGRGGPGFAGTARVPAGHPEGYLEAFASL